MSMNQIHCFRPMELSEAEFDLFESLTRRRFIIGAGALAIGAITGCGSQEEAAGPTTTTSAGYPRTVTHLGGETTLTKRPERVIVTDGLIFLDFLLALGVDALAYGIYNDYMGGPRNPDLAPWTVTALNARPTLPEAIPNGPPNLEQLVQMRPDLLVRFDFDSPFDKVAEFAPVVVSPGDFAGITTLFGTIFNLEDRATQLLAEWRQGLGEIVAVARQRGQNITIGTPFERSIWAYNPGDTYLPGLMRAAGIQLTARGPESELQVQIAEERFDLLDGDQLWLLAPTETDVVWAEQIENSPIFQSLPVVRDDRYHRLSIEQSRALMWPSTLAFPTIRDTLVGLLS